ncbi:hypothetical protein BGZ76_001398 [Entomortierella beljakovae]|nr:hypothetical protein BGZ76_001398 [Entomortierella beljakovae]
MEPPRATAQPAVIIIGAGIGGLMMGLLLEQIGVMYHIFERASEVKPLGSAMAFGPTILAALEQLGLYEELLQVSKTFDNIYFFQGDCKSIGMVKRATYDEKFGYKELVFSRPDFYEILRRRIPEEKITFKKKVLRVEEKEGAVTVHCSDNTSYMGDIVIGADGAYSGVRQSMYKQLNEKGLLPKSDMDEFSIGYTIMVGVAKGDPEKYPILKDESSQFSQIVYNGDSNCYVITLPDNQISWGFGTQISRETMREMQFRSSEWSVDAGESTLKPFRHYPSPIGGTMGDIFDATPKEFTSKVYLEEKIFQTWHHGRTVLLGDACHKYHPAGGQDTSEKSIHAAFSDYYNQRFSYAKIAFDNSTSFAKVLNGQKLSEKMLRKIYLNYIPTWLIDVSVAHVVKYRPQVAWLPLADRRGKSKVLPQDFERPRRTDSVGL